MSTRLASPPRMLWPDRLPLAFPPALRDTTDMRDLALSHAVTEMSTGAATLAIVAALALGFYTARWLRAERDEQGARASLAGAVGAMWRARRVMAWVVIAGAVLLDVWFRGKGR